MLLEFVSKSHEFAGMVFDFVLKNQSVLVINKFRNFNLILIKKIYFDDWVTIIMVKKDKN